MSETVFTKVDYDLGSLIKYISLGEIGLPDIQRPFVWANSKVRDLFDSMYKGYPVGYLLFWQNTLSGAVRTIGTDAKQKPPRLVIVDGQQRLTSLYAVLRRVPVIRENFASEHICIAFNPLQEKFEVTDAAIRRDKAFIPDISVLWAEDAKITKIIREYIEGIQSSREVSDVEEQDIEDRILRLQSLLSFPLTALELISDIDEEAVSDVFVRINSKGTPLNQADFILTLMSVFWDEGRAALERFCREARKPSKGVASPFNHFIEPSPDQLLRVGVGVAFKRARLKYVYSILRGKDLETEAFSEDLRIQQFEVLKKGQERALNLQYWHDFMHCLRTAGFRSSRMITSQNNLLFSYMLYLIGRTEYRVPEFELRRIIARWYFMSALTGRFSSSPESDMEFDMAGLRDVKAPEDFVSYLGRICDLTLTSDFWNFALPNDLATSSSRSPSLVAFHASLVLLDAPVLFSRTKVADLLDPSVQGNRNAVERHHLFPKGYLSKIGFDSVRETNQIANYALVEWKDNLDMAEKSPAEYLPEMKMRFSQDEVSRMYHLHALPMNWEQMDYRDFLEKRRDLISSVIAEGYNVLCEGARKEAIQQDLFDLTKSLITGESETQEFKSTLRTNLHTGQKDPRMELAILKTLAGFLNTRGGTLIVGVSDDGTPIGLDADGFESEDRIGLHLVNIVKARMGIHAMTCINIHFDDQNGCRILVVHCQQASTPVFVKDENAERFYIRTGSSTTELTPSQMHEYVRQRFSSY